MQTNIQIGTEDSADLRILGSNCFPRHAEVQRSSGRTTCMALIGDEDDLLAETFTWLDGNQLRTGCQLIDDLEEEVPGVSKLLLHLPKQLNHDSCFIRAGPEHLCANILLMSDCNVVPGVGYLLSPASKLAFGELQNEYTIDFEEAKTDTSMIEMLIKGMASQSSQEVRDQFDM